MALPRSEHTDADKTTRLRNHEADDDPPTLNVVMRPEVHPKEGSSPQLLSIGRAMRQELQPNGQDMHARVV